MGVKVIILCSNLLIEIAQFDHENHILTYLCNNLKFLASHPILMSTWANSRIYMSIRITCIQQINWNKFIWEKTMESRTYIPIGVS